MAIILLLWNRAFWKKAYHLFAPLSIKGKNYLLFIVYSAVNLYMTWQVVVRNAGNWPLEARILPDLDQKIARAHSILILLRICQIQTWKMSYRASNSIDAIWKLYLKMLKVFFHNGTPSKKKKELGQQTSIVQLNCQLLDTAGKTSILWGRNFCHFLSDS